MTIGITGLIESMHFLGHCRVMFGCPSTTRPDFALDIASVFLNFCLHWLGLIAFSLSPSTVVIPIPTCAYNSCRSTKERPTRIHLILQVEVDPHLLAQSPINIGGV